MPKKQPASERKKRSSGSRSSKVSNKSKTIKKTPRKTPRKSSAESISDSSAWKNLSYNMGFGNHFESEAIPGSLVKGRNNPQKAPMGLYAEQHSGTPFTFAKTKNQRSWLYKILPTVVHKDWKDVSHRFKSWTDKCERVNPE